MLHVGSGQPSNFNGIPVIYPQVSGQHSVNYAQQVGLPGLGMNHPGSVVNSLGSGRALLSTNFPGMGFNAVNICNKIDQITNATASAAPEKSPQPPR
eukprot:789845-Rhodomonas_salina.1